MELTAVKGIIAVTLSTKNTDKKRLVGLNSQELFQLSTDALATIISPTLIREAAADYDGDTIQIIFSI
ncbi:MAG TPA: hypothetical protein VJ036_00325 [bacterium]|jgi:hypothetical protein|nr:hypothetical protein [bacterium]